MPERAAVIIADPPWSYANWSDAAHGAARSAYSCMAIEDICAIPVGDQFAAKDCMLYLWVTGPKIPEGLKVCEAWGFEYVAWIPWVKFTPSTGQIYRGIGFHTMAAAEMLFICRRGKPKAKDRKDTPIGLLVGEERVFWAPRTKHSKKPEEIQDWIERKFDGPYLELFARRNRPSWTCYGNELGTELGSYGVRPCEVVKNGH
jgi:N6-adenosine-specific RNA methylase IME4